MRFYTSVILARRMSRYMTDILMLCLFELRSLYAEYDEPLRLILWEVLKSTIHHSHKYYSSSTDFRICSESTAGLYCSCVSVLF